ARAVVPAQAARSACGMKRTRAAAPSARWARSGLAAACVSVPLLALAAPKLGRPSNPAAPAALPLVAVDPRELVVSDGAIELAAGARFRIRSAELRAVLARATAPEAALLFQYLGPSAASSRLASGELRRQIGVKLRARDSCNLVYVMWQIEP